MGYETDLQLFIDGVWKSGEGRDAHTVVNPVTGGGTRPGLRAVRFERGKYKSNPSTGMMVARVPQQATLVLPPNSEMIPAAAQ
jgi:hypothetical protein